MRSIQFSEYGNPDSVRLVEEDPTTVGAGQVRVALEAAPLNPSDFMLLDGRYPFRPALPSPAGSEGVGIVTETGAGVTGVQTGDRVLIIPSGQPGTWQDEDVVDERLVVRVERDIDPLQLATVAINAATAVLVLRYGAPLPAGSWIAQTAANSGLGAFVRALARRAGLHVVDVVRTEDAAVDLRAAGAAHVVVGDDTIDEQLGAILDGAQVRLLLDGVGGDVVSAFGPFLAREAHVVSFAALSGRPVAVHPMHLNFKNLHVHGFWLNNWLDTAPAEEIALVYREIVDLVADGVLTTPVEASYSLDEYVKAIEHARGGGRRGKVLFRSTPQMTR